MNAHYPKDTEGAPTSGKSLISGVQGVTHCQVARAETWENAGSGRMNENRLYRVSFNNKSSVKTTRGRKLSEDLHGVRPGERDASLAV